MSQTVHLTMNIWIYI